MITPDFDISQDTARVILSIKIKYIKTSDIQVDIQRNEFKLYANPYFLRLNFPGNLLEDDNIVQYNIDTGILHLEIKKEEPVEFKDLEFNLKLTSKITTAPTNTPNTSKALIQDLSLDLEEMVQQEDIDWESPQVIHQPSLEKKYGFNSGYSGLGMQLESVSRDMLEIYNIDSIESDFKEIQRQKQDEKFDLEYYLEDLKDGIPKEIQEFKSEYSTLLYKVQKGQLKEMSLTSQDIIDLGNFSSREYLLDNPIQIYLGLVDLMFSYSYNYLINTGDNNSESAWNLVKLSSTLGSFVVFDSLTQVIIACFRSSLAWPLLRNWEFSLKVLNHTAILFKLGKKALAKSLLEIKRILESDDRCFTICQIWINDYITWIQSPKSCSEKTLSSLASKLHHFKIEKTDVTWDLSEAGLES